MAEPIEPLHGMPRKRAADGRIEIDGSKPGGWSVTYWSHGALHSVAVLAGDHDGEPCADQQQVEEFLHRYLEETRGVVGVSVRVLPLPGLSPVGVELSEHEPKTEDPAPLDRAREAHLLAHPEDATPNDVREAMLSLRAMREAGREQAEANGGCVVVVTMFVRDTTLRVGFTAPSMDDERIAALCARSMELLSGTQREDGDAPPDEPTAPLDGPLQVIAVGAHREFMHRVIAELPERCAIVILAGDMAEGLAGAREAGALLYQPARVVPLGSAT